MAKMKRVTIGEFNGLGGQVNSANLPDDFAEVFQNWRFDEQGVLTPRYGIAHAMQIHLNLVNASFSNGIDAIAEIETDNARCVLMQAGKNIFYSRSEADKGTFGSGANGYAKWDTQRSVEPAPKPATIPYAHMTRYDAIPLVQNSVWTSIAGGHTVSVVFRKGTGAFGSNGAIVSNTSLQQLCPYIMGIEMVLDGKPRHRWVYGTEGDYANESFAAVSVSTSETTWQFRYIYQDGSMGPLSQVTTPAKAD